VICDVAISPPFDHFEIGAARRNSAGFGWGFVSLPRAQHVSQAQDKKHRDSGQHQKLEDITVHLDLVGAWKQLPIALM
jgi:hypothetical protein